VEALLGVLARGDVLGDAEQVQRLPALVVDGDLLGVQPALTFVFGRDRFLGDVDEDPRAQRLLVRPAPMTSAKGSSSDSRIASRSGSSTSTPAC
jgi:hypothetical protein